MSVLEKMKENREIKEQVRELLKFMGNQELLTIISDYQELLRVGGAECLE